MTNEQQNDILRALDQFDLDITEMHFRLHAGGDPSRCTHDECLKRNRLLAKARSAAIRITVRKT